MSGTEADADGAALALAVGAALGAGVELIALGDGVGDTAGDGEPHATANEARSTRSWRRMLGKR